METKPAAFSGLECQWPSAMAPAQENPLRFTDAIKTPPLWIPPPLASLTSQNIAVVSWHTMPFLVPLFYVYSIYLYCIHILIYFFFLCVHFPRTRKDSSTRYGTTIQRASASRQAWWKPKDWGGLACGTAISSTTLMSLPGNRPTACGMLLCNANGNTDHHETHTHLESTGNRCQAGIILCGWEARRFAFAVCFRDISLHFNVNYVLLPFWISVFNIWCLSFLETLNQLFSLI